MIKKLQDKCIDYSVKFLTDEDIADIFDLYKSNPDYFEIVEGRLPKLEDCINDIKDCPPNFPKEKKYFIGFYQNGKLTVVLDFLMGFPDEDIFYVGLYMVEGKSRSKGYGRKLLSEVLEVAFEAGFKRLCLGVISENLNAVNFWMKNGLKEIKRVPRERDNGTVAEVIVMEKGLEG